MFRLFSDWSWGMNISDHAGVFIRFTNNACINSPVAGNYIFKRMINNTNTNKFLDVLKQENWTSLLSPNFNHADFTDIFLDTFTQIINNCFPFVTIATVSNVKWFTNKLQRMKRDLDKFRFFFSCYQYVT